MSEEITIRVQALMLACLKVNSQGKHHVFFNFYGHVDVIDVYASPASTNYQNATSLVRTLKTTSVQLKPDCDENADQAEARICHELDEAAAAVAALMNQEAA